MKTLSVLLAIVGMLSCHKGDQTIIQPDPGLGPVLEADGRIADYAAVDGCGLSLRIPKDSTNITVYTISDRSQSLIQRYVVYQNSVADLKANVRFQLTRQKKEISCGWSGPKAFDEVLLLSIKPL